MIENVMDDKHFAVWSMGDCWAIDWECAVCWIDWESIVDWLRACFVNWLKTYGLIDKSADWVIDGESFIWLILVCYRKRLIEMGKYWWSESV